MRCLLYIRMTLCFFLKNNFRVIEVCEQRGVRVYSREKAPADEIERFPESGWGGIHPVDTRSSKSCIPAHKSNQAVLEMHTAAKGRGIRGGRLERHHGILSTRQMARRTGRCCMLWRQAYTNRLGKIRYKIDNAINQCCKRRLL